MEGNDIASIAVYPGSFDPLTFGHLDIIERSSKLFETLFVTTMINSSKNHLFTLEERQEMLQNAVKHLPNVRVTTFNGLLVKHFEEIGASVIIKGLREVSDYENEVQMASGNRHLNPRAETLFMPTSAQYSFLSSSLVKEIFKHGGNVDGLVPHDVKLALDKKSGKR